MTNADDFAPRPFEIASGVDAAEMVFGCSNDDEPLPEGLRDVVELVRSARRPGSMEELIDHDVMVARIAAAIEQAQAPVQTPRLSRLSKLRSAKVATVVAVMAMVGGTAAAAATGSLPSPIHHVLAGRHSGVHVELPVRHHMKRTADTTATRRVETPSVPTSAVRAQPTPHGPSPVHTHTNGNLTGTLTVTSPSRSHRPEFHPPTRSLPDVASASRPGNQHGHANRFAHVPHRPKFGRRPRFDPPGQSRRPKDVTKASVRRH